MESTGTMENSLTQAPAVRQVIVVRTDLKMRRGKESAQVAHAAMMFLRAQALSPYREFSEAELLWLAGIYTKVVVAVDSEKELVQVMEDARKRKVRCYAVTDVGLTEFHGRTTLTCCALGPDYTERLDEITRHLKLR